MSPEDEKRAHAAALANPVEAVKVLRITVQTSDAELYETFMREYENVNAGSADNPISQSTVSAAVRDWKIDRQIPSWLARACVVASKQVA
jgi:pyruvate kinase